MAGSFEAPKTGDHFGVLINDDPHNEKNVGTIDQILKVIEGWKNLDYLGDGDRTRRFYAATRWHFADVNNAIMEELAPRFCEKFKDKTFLYNQPLANIEPEDDCAVYLLSAWSDEQESDVIWPEKQSRKVILKWKSKHGAYKFGCQMLNDPIPPEDRTFNPENFCYYTTSTELNDKGIPTEYYVCGEEKIGADPDTNRPIYKYRKIPVNETTNIMTVDPAYGIKRHNDYVGIVVAAHWTDPKTRLRWLIVLETVRQKMTTAQSKRKIEELYAKWDCRKVGIEGNALQAQYVEGLAGDPRWGGDLNIQVVRITRGTGDSKGVRVTRLEGPYETHRVWHAPGMRGGVLEQELLGFVGALSRGSSDDVADAMSDHVDFEVMIKLPDFNPLETADLPRVSAEDAKEDWESWDDKEWLRV